MQILIVDDSVAMRRVVKKVVTTALRELGTESPPEFVEAPDGHAALRMLAESPGIDVVLCDISMPKMDGIEFVRSVREQKEATIVRGATRDVLRTRANSLYVIMVTAEGALDRVYQALRAGANDYVQKPFVVSDFTEKLAALVAEQP